MLFYIATDLFRHRKMQLHTAQSRCVGIGRRQSVLFWQQRVGCKVKLPVRANTAQRVAARLQTKALISHFQPVKRERVLCRSTAAQLQSETELFLDNLVKETANDAVPASDLRNQMQQLENQVLAVQSDYKLADHNKFTSSAK